LPTRRSPDLARFSPSASSTSSTRLPTAPTRILPRGTGSNHWRAADLAGGRPGAAPALPRLREQRPINIQVPPAHIFNIELVLGQPAPGPAQPLTQIGVACQPANRVGQGLRIARRHQQAGFI